MDGFFDVLEGVVLGIVVEFVGVVVDDYFVFVRLVYVVMYGVGYDYNVYVRFDWFGYKCLKGDGFYWQMEVCYFGQGV